MQTSRLVFVSILVVTIFGAVTAALAVTHDDSEFIYPELYIGFRGTGSGTPTLTVNFDAYQLPNGSGGLTNYTETVSTNGFSNGVTWTNMSIYVQRGMPLDQSGTLRIAGQNIAEYKVFINSPDAKYQPYVTSHEQHLIYWTNTAASSTVGYTNYLMFKHQGDDGAIAGKASSVMPGWRNFKLALGYGKTGKSLGYVTFLYGNQPVLSDTSQELLMINYTNGGATHSELVVPSMAYDMQWNSTNSDPGFLPGAYTIKCYDPETQPGVLATNGGVVYFDFSGYTPVISYVLDYATDNTNTTTKVVRTEGTTSMDSYSTLKTYDQQPEYINVCFPPITIPGCCFPDNYCSPSWSIPGICFPFTTVKAAAGTVSTNFAWATAGLGGTRNAQTSITAIKYNTSVPPTPLSESITNNVNLGALIDSSYGEQSTSYKTFPNGYYYWPSFTTKHDGALGYFTSSEDYNWNPGTGGHLKQYDEVEPDGNWTYFEYYDDIDERGMISRVTKPFGDKPTTPATNTVGTLITQYTYTNDWDNSKTLPAEVVTRLKESGTGNDLVVSRTKYDYSGSFTNGDPNQPALYQGTLPIWVTEEHDYYGPGVSNYTVTITKRFRPDTARMFANLPVSIQRPDGTKDVWNYEVGSYDPSSRTFTPNNSSNPLLLLYSYSTYAPAATRIWKISAFPSTAPGAESFYIDSSYLVPYKSTAELTTRDQFGRVVKDENAVYIGGGLWSPLEAESHNYDAAGNLIASYKLMDGEGPNVWVPVYEAEYTDVNGGTLNYSSVAFSNSGNPTGRKQYERDRQGTITAYTYDNYGRVASSTVLQAPDSSNPALQTYYTYDSDNRIVSTAIGTSVSDPNALVTSNAYNPGGFQVYQSKPGGYVTTNDYSQLSSGIVTQTILGRGDSTYNRTIITSKNTDESVQYISGTATIPKCFTNLIVNINGTVTLSDGSTELAGTLRSISSQGSASRPFTTRTNVVDYDWLGHVIRQESANPASAGNLVTTYTYNNNGQLAQTVTGDLAPVLNQYDSFGQLFRSGIKLADGSGNTNLNPASLDRISEQSTSFQYANGGWWEVTTNLTYPNTNDATPFVVKQTWVLRSGFTRVYDIPYDNSLMLDNLTRVIDASGNWTETGTLYDRDYAYSYTEVDSDLTGGPSYLTGGSGATGWSTQEIDINGQKIYHLNGDGTAEDVFNYDSYGRLSSDQKYVNNSLTPQTTTYTYRPTSTEIVWQQNPDNTCVSNIYNPEGLVSSTINYTNTTATGGKQSQFSYNLRGQLTATWGDIPYPYTNIYYTSAIGSDYTAELEGNIYEQRTFNGGIWTNWPSALPAGNTNRFYYFPQSGLLQTKSARGPGISNVVQYTYNQRRDLLTRTWNRGVVTTYAYNESVGYNSGELASVAYSNDPSGTNDPGLSYSYNRLGALSGVTDACGSRAFIYRSTDQQLDHQVLPSGVYGSGLQLGLNYDGYGRLSGYWLGASSGTAPVSIGYQYYDSGPSDFSGRLSAITTPVGTFGYTYRPGTPQVANVSGPSVGGSSSFGRTDQFDPNNNLTTNSITGFGSFVLANYTCQYDGFHRLSAAAQTGQIYSLYGPGLSLGLNYNDRNEVTGSTTYLTNSLVGMSTAGALPRRKFAYTYDSDGNRTNTTVDSDPTLNYTINSLEQYTSRARPPFVEVSGIVNTNTVMTAMRSNVVFALTDLSVGTNGNSYFYGKSNRTGTNAGGETLSLSNVLYIAGAGVVTNLDVRGILAPPTNQIFTYDKDGNLTNDALWVYSYDDEDRIKQIQSAPSLLTVTNVTPVRLNFTYDFLGRRVQKQVWNYIGGSWVLTNTIVFAYDGLNLIAEYHWTNSTLVLDKSYYWGLDKSGSLQGGGGVGGLLAMVTHSTPTTGKYAAVSDPWGNVVAMLDINTGIPMAEFEYNPFGEPLRSMGVLAANCPWRFSTKYWDRETGLLNFDYRYYSPGMGRFLNRDPKDELGRLQLSAPLQGGGLAAWGYIGKMVGIPGKSPSLTPYKSTGLAQSNERQDTGYRDSAEAGDIFRHRKSSGATGGGEGNSSNGSMPQAPAYNHPYGFVNNNPYQGFDPLGLDDWGDDADAAATWFGNWINSEFDSLVDSITPQQPYIDFINNNAAVNNFNSGASGMQNLSNSFGSSENTITGLNLTPQPNAIFYPGQNSLTLYSLYDQMVGIPYYDPTKGANWTASFQQDEFFKQEFDVALNSINITLQVTATVGSLATAQVELIPEELGTMTLEVGKATDSEGMLAGSIRNVNPTGGTMNCVNCSIATDATLAGSPASALPGGPTSISVLEDTFGGAFQPVSGQMQVGSILSQAGNGSRGIVFGESLSGDVGHVFNVFNNNGSIQFLDGQIGGSGLGNFNSFQNFQFLLTHPGTP